jgi:hypothetical protein
LHSTMTYSKHQHIQEAEDVLNRFISKLNQFLMAKEETVQKAHIEKLLQSARMLILHLRQEGEKTESLAISK